MHASPSQLWQTAWALPFAWKAYGKMNGQPKTCMLTKKFIIAFMLAKIWHSVTFNLKGFWLYTFSGLRMQLTNYVVSAPLVTYQHHMPSVPIINVLVLGTHASDILFQRKELQYSAQSPILLELTATWNSWFKVVIIESIKNVDQYYNFCIMLPNQHLQHMTS